MKQILIVFTILLLLSPSLTLASAIEDGLNESATQSGLANQDEVDTNSEVLIAEKIGSIIQIFLSVIGLIFMVIVMYGGLYWMTAFGDQGKVTKAKNLILYPILGMIVIAISYVLVNFVVSNLGQQF
ncbi:hypothetical protein COT97_04880 [Candidatus Falkowbacteria bacterium CG10_big_fil_rev_8_21_14_0_10_39_11]|uniref:Yip1 domain-containing protein n=1 Tax=Candidatus Falkowbacteria bacterium CG10_big_fil_rev_8_21_14_0_10_39_11 TaxID=1974565 RepID=A0A2H0V5T4_9BACT|nr:MAG: hypothetical protein COT97_04880 [Candidatus Falkowbacteria bacterium CG10_big_fil_rev_8_21_14_0_10_39_11]